jgi:hypothetical protein
MPAPIRTAVAAPCQESPRLGPSWWSASEDFDVEVRITSAARLELRISGSAEVARPSLRVALVLPPGALASTGACHAPVTRGSSGAVALELRPSQQVEVVRVADGAAMVRIHGRCIEFKLRASERALSAGDIESLVADLEGSANLVVRGAAEHADLTVAGMGHISVARVRKTLRRLCTGGGGIHVSCPPSAAADFSSRRSPRPR